MRRTTTTCFESGCLTFHLKSDEDRTLFLCSLCIPLASFDHHGHLAVIHRSEDIAYGTVERTKAKATDGDVIVPR